MATKQWHQIAALSALLSLFGLYYQFVLLDIQDVIHTNLYWLLTVWLTFSIFHSVRATLSQTVLLPYQPAGCVVLFMLVMHDQQYPVIMGDDPTASWGEMILRYLVFAGVPFFQLAAVLHPEARNLLVAQLKQGFGQLHRQ